MVFEPPGSERVYTTAEEALEYAWGMVHRVYGSGHHPDVEVREVSDWESTNIQVYRRGKVQP
jgi:hypothetical protein